MRRLAVLACVVAVVTAVPAAASPARDAKPRPPAQRAALATAIVAQLNVIRASNNLAPLVANAKLAAAATAHTNEMLTKGYFAHESADGTSPILRVKHYYGKGIVGENLLWFVGNMNAATVVDAWMNNPPHKAVILDPRWRAIGVAAMFSRKAPGYYKNRPTTAITADFGA
jgi:uncharacterized protein YkwD